jgi:hypothetical protein
LNFYDGKVAGVLRHSDCEATEANLNLSQNASSLPWLESTSQLLELRNGPL